MAQLPLRHVVRRLHVNRPEVDMNLRAWSLPLLMLATIPLAGCELVGDIFKAGMWVGVVFVVLIVGLVGFIASKMRA
jgi:uncharacterized membrane protein YkvI